MLRDFLSYYRPWKGLFWLDFSCAVLAGLLELAFPIAVMGFIDHLLPQDNWALTIWAAVGLMALYVISAGLMAIVTYWGHMLGINIETEMRRRAFAHLQKLSWRFFDQNRTGHLMARVNRDLEEIGEVAHHGPEDLFIALMTFIGVFIAMLWMNPTLAWVTAAIVPITFGVMLVAGSRMTRTWRTIYERVGNFNVRLEENLGGIRIVQAFGNEAHEKMLFERDNASYRKTKLDAYRVMAGSVTLQYLGMRVVQVLIMVIGAALVLNGDMTAGTFVAFLLMVNVFFRPLDKLASVIETYPRGIAGFRRYQELLNTEPDIADAADARNLDSVKGDIQFNTVSFSYDDTSPVLRDISLNIEAGQTVAFVGQSGAGKSTLLSLLPRFYDVTKGSITVDGIDIRDLTLSSLRQHIGIVSQDVYLFGGTLRENIAYGRLDASEAEIIKASELAQLSGLITSLDDGLDTIVGERGTRLSGGEKQRVSIARAFLRNPPIMILDEATSALDPKTEVSIQTALAELSKGRTTLVIAHRLSTIRHADQVVVMDGGCIIENGAHDTLRSADGAFADMIKFGSPA